jgi:hypothetical protein
MTEHFCDQDQGCQKEEGEREDAMKLPSLSFDPGFRRVNDLAAMLGVGAVVFPGTGVTGIAR